MTLSGRDERHSRIRIAGAREWTRNETLSAAIGTLREVIQDLPGQLPSNARLHAAIQSCRLLWQRTLAALEKEKSVRGSAHLQLLNSTFFRHAITVVAPATAGLPQSRFPSQQGGAPVRLHR